MLVVQRGHAWFLEIKLLFLNEHLGHHGASRHEGLLSNGARSVQSIFHGNVDALYRCPGPLMPDDFARSGQRSFVDMFGFMHLCVLLPNADGGGLRPRRIFCG